MIPAPIQRTGAIRVHVSHWSWSAANGGEYRLGSTRLRAGDHVVLITLPDNHGPVLRAMTGETG